MAQQLRHDTAASLAVARLSPLLLLTRHAMNNGLCFERETQKGQSQNETDKLF